MAIRLGRSVALLACLVSLGCGEEESESNAVEIVVHDETGTLTGDFIKSIYDPANDQDFRYVKYDSSHDARFEDVEPGRYRAHATPVSLNNGNWADISVEDGDFYTITFTYFIDGYVCVPVGSGCVEMPHYWWRNTVVKN